MRAAAILVLLLISACGPTRVVTRTQTVEISRLRYVPLPARLTAPTAAPTAEPGCLWQSAPTLCVGELAERCALLDEALASCNADKAAISDLQKQTEGNK